MLIAVSDTDADARRSAVARIAQSKDSRADWAIKGYVAIALLENDTQARLVAIRALADSDDPRGVETLMKLLNHQDFPPQEVRPPDALCRWDALTGVARLVESGAVKPEQHAAVRDAFLRDLENPDRNVRIAAARGLGTLPGNDAALDKLIAGLRDEQFAVAFECENSLMRLTGVTNDCNPAAWESWREANRAAPFARAGQIPDSHRLPYGNRWEKMAHDTRQLVRWAFPEDKPR